MFQHCSRMKEAICYLGKLKKIDNRKKLKEHINTVSTPKIGTKYYDSSIPISEFEYSDTFRSLYDRPPDYFMVPSVRKASALI